MTKVISKNAAIINLKGKGKSQREGAFMAIAPLSFVEDTSRSQSIANLNVALGMTPSEVEIATAKREWTIGRVASRLPAGEIPGGASLASFDKLEYARKLIVEYAAPAKEGTTARKLRKGQTGRRSAMQHRVIRNAEEAWSQVAAELGFSNAKTQSERNANKAKRAPQMAGSAKDAAKPTHTELVKPAAPVTADDATAHLLGQSSTLLMYSNKNAALLPTDFQVAVKAFRKAIVAADAARKVALAVKA